jgi:hypothetical protein
MAIAILGWGSLCWNPGELLTVGGWEPTGPMLPIEFARISRADRLNLCLFAGADLVQVYWIRSAAPDLETARDNLRSRQNCVTAADIGYLARDGSFQFRSLPGLAANVKSWLEVHPDLEAVIWTDLRSNFEAKTGGTSFTVESGIAWLQELVRANRHQRAEEYLRKAPPQTETRLRARAREVFGWTNVEAGMAATGAGS